MAFDRSKAPGTALRLIREATLEHGPIFSSREALETGAQLGMSQASTYKALSAASQAGVAYRLKGGMYRSAPPFGPPHVHEFVIATSLVRPSVISGVSALSHWGLIDQTPMRIVTASTPKSVVPPDARSGTTPRSQMPGRLGWVIDGITYVYRRIPEREMFGIIDVWLDTETQVKMFDRERTLIDTFIHMRGEGTGHLGDALLGEHGTELDLDLLLHYATQSDKPIVVQRVKRAIESAGLTAYFLEVSS
jgi:predicted transcriptional regulator of viral defense system